jgi:hypothetical protein
VARTSRLEGADFAAALQIAASRLEGADFAADTEQLFASLRP